MRPPFVSSLRLSLPVLQQSIYIIHVHCRPAIVNFICNTSPHPIYMHVFFSFWFPSFRFVSFGFSLGFLFIPLFSTSGFVVDVFRGGFHSLFCVPSFFSQSLASYLQQLQILPDTHHHEYHHRQFLHIITHTRHFIICIFFL